MLSTSEELKNNRIKNSTRNIFTGMLLMLTVTIFPFIIRTLIICNLGEQIMGLNSVMQSTIALLNLADLGLSTVVTYFIFKPAAKGDIKIVNAYLSELKKIYLYVAILFFIIGLIVFIFIPTIVGAYQVLNVKVKSVYLIFLMATIIQYLLWPESDIILNAYQRKDIQNTIYLISQIVMYIFQILSICLMRSYYVYVIIIFFQGIFKSYCQHFIIKKKFSDIKPYGKLNKIEIKKIRKKFFAMMGHRLDEKLISYMDTIFISIYLDLKYVTIYGNYLYIITALSMLTGVIYDSILASIGNAIVVETPESNKIRFNCIFYISAIISGWTTMCLVCLFQPFMNIWMPGLLLSNKEMLCFCVFSYLSQMRKTVQVFKNAAGMWEQDKLKPYVSMIVNIVLNAILIKYFGVLGAIFASIICIGFIEFPWETFVLYNNYFKMNLFDFFIRFIKYTIINSSINIIIYMIINNFFITNGFIDLLIKGILLAFLGMVIYIFSYRFYPEFSIWKSSIFKFKK